MGATINKESIKIKLSIPALCVDPERGGDPPLKNHKNIGFLSNTGPDPLKNQHSMLGHHQHASDVAGGPMMAHL